MGICLINEYDLNKDRFFIQTRNIELPTHNAHLYLYKYLMQIKVQQIICERFQHRPNQQAVDNRAGEYVGVVQLWAQTYNIPILMQNSSLVGKSAFWSDDNKRVKQLDLYDSKAAPHGMDALRHFLYHITFTMKSNFFLERLPKE